MALNREEFRKTAKFKFNLLWCQHCKAMQKANETVVDCYYNPLSEEGEFSFCASSTDAIDSILKAHGDMIREIKEGLEKLDTKGVIKVNFDSSAGLGFRKLRDNPRPVNIRGRDWQEFWQKYPGGG